MRPRQLFLACCALVVVDTANALEQSGWNSTLERISSGVVSIRVDSTRAFDTNWNSSSQATGFVIDAKQGLILTNRHVVTSGPVIAEAVFRNNEEVTLTPVYRDPVHDFGLFRYNPEDLRYIQPTELELFAGGAETGKEIRVVGNDAGEQLSILAGTIARLDRDAPSYGRGKYNDFNTFYYQAASGTSGGSSGSPVIDISGRVVALNAGASNAAASSFFLPLHRVERAVDLLKSGNVVSRGTLQTVFVRKPFDELRRLGLRTETETEARDSMARQTGMLVVRESIAGSPADEFLVSGDILVRIDGKLIAEFVPLAAILDDNVGKTVRVEVERGGDQLTADLLVTDLHAISPDAFLQFGDAIVHNLSYQQARHYNRPLSGVFVANPGYIFSNSAIPRGAVITEFDGHPVATIDDLERVLEGLADSAKAAARFVTLEAPQTENLRIVRMERRWFPAARCHRDDGGDEWPCRELAAGPPQEKPEGGSTSFVLSDDRTVNLVAPSLVLVNFDMPYSVSGVEDRHYYGSGLIVDVERGLVVVDRNTVPVAIGDVNITFAGSLEIPGKVEFVHPLHNLAVVSYDPALIGDTPVKAARLETRGPKPGESVWFVGLRGDHRIAHQQTTIASVDALNLPLTRTLRFRDSNIEAISVVNAPQNLDGILVNRKGHVLAMWSSFAVQSGNSSDQINRGIPTSLVRELVDIVKAGKPLYSLEAELAYTPLASARKLGLPEDLADRVEAHNDERRQVLSILRLVAGTPASDILRPGDLILFCDEKVVSTFRELERCTQEPRVELSVWRNSELATMTVDTVALDGTGIDKALVWAGALLQAPHRAIAAQRGIKPTGVYVAFFNYGSPATRYGLWGGRRIVEVDGTLTPDLDAFVAAIRDKGHREALRLKTVNWNDAVEVITLKLDNQYWPAYQVRQTDSGWVRESIGAH